MNMFRKFRPHKVQIELLMPASGWSAPNRYVGDSPQKQTLYEQGQSPAPKIREYFYYIDHEGYLFLDDARMKNFTSCFKDKPFLKFFFDRLKRNESNRYADTFPFISICGRERNFIRCDDLPIVFTHSISTKEHDERLSYAHCGELLTVPFEPQKVYMSETSGRVYHPAEAKHGSIGLVSSKLSFEFSRHFEFEDTHEFNANVEFPPPSRFVWNGITHRLDREWVIGLPNSDTLKRTDLK